MKKIAWVTVLKKENNEEHARKLNQTLSKYGMGTAGHFWRDDLDKRTDRSATERFSDVRADRVPRLGLPYSWRVRLGANSDRQLESNHRQSEVLPQALDARIV